MEPTDNTHIGINNTSGGEFALEKLLKKADGDENTQTETNKKDFVESSVIISDDEDDTHHGVAYRVNDVPPVGIIVSIGVQNLLLSLGAAVSAAYVIADVICAHANHPVRAKLFSTTLLMSGICTTLQPLIGVRLPVFQGVSSTFLIPLLAMRNDREWQCDRLNQHHMTHNSTAENSTLEIEEDAELYLKLRQMMGCLLLSSMFEIIVGATGLVGFLLRYIGPITIATTVSLIGLSLYHIPIEYSRTHWGLSIMCIVITTVFILYMDRIHLPIPAGCTRAGRKGKNSTTRGIPIFQMFPVLFGILITWVVCGILTATDVLSDDPSTLEFRARTDTKMQIIRTTPWLYVPYPGQFGSPLFNTAIFVGFLSAVISSILESIGDYYATAQIAKAPPPPSHAVNRGILMEGLGSILSGAMGAGHATTSHTTNIALIGISRVASRYCLIFAGILLVIMSLIGKVGAVLTTMPDPAVGGAMFVAFGTITALGVFNLRTIDLTSSRNLAIFGISVYTGIVIPEWVARYPESLHTGDASEGVLKGLLGNPMFLGGVVSVILDNTVKGTLKERGMDDREGLTEKSEKDLSSFNCTESEAYDVSYVNTILRKLPCLRVLPFLQPYRKETFKKTLRSSQGLDDAN